MMYTGLRVRLKLLLFGFLWLFVLTGYHQLSRAENAPDRAITDSNVAPDAVAKRFYLWYLNSLASHREPRRDVIGLRRFVSANLMKELENPNLSEDEDYFLKSQDFLKEWVGHVGASRAKYFGERARTTVSLGAGDSMHKISVAFERESTGWKIDSVRESP